MVSPAQRREALEHVQAKGLSGRAACRWTGLSRTVLRYAAKQSNVDQARLKQMREASHRQPRFGYTCPNRRRGPARRDCGQVEL